VKTGSTGKVSQNLGRLKTLEGGGEALTPTSEQGRILRRVGEKSGLETVGPTKSISAGICEKGSKQEGAKVRPSYNTLKNYYSQCAGRAGRTDKKTVSDKVPSLQS